MAQLNPRGLSRRDELNISLKNCHKVSWKGKGNGKEILLLPHLHRYHKEWVEETPLNDSLLGSSSTVGGGVTMLTVISHCDSPSFLPFLLFFFFSLSFFHSSPSSFLVAGARWRWRILLVAVDKWSTALAINSDLALNKHNLNLIMMQ